ncbi:hypothetical protein [Evansella cellulosilytica]|uniref:Uncharacterized protein n=1 Tax=Evansella cellulosilytica (strain ATCC 21833 / DSM 2522 / FERM P-1141 / JCM 9156 / N-4) TaxID=649639 RepID=E6TZT8_EVAC2|nr:hypothetical protein [Evansella cellulosilytica]ADU32504.1 hypothetical protein Bcell_4277 [Evansella cellulosilytica DSM 2522]
MTAAQFDFFDYGKNKTTRESPFPTINISKAGRINLNKKFVNTLMKDNNFIQLGYNAKTKQIAIKLCKTNNDEKALKINQTSKGNATYTSAISFFKFNKIDLDSVHGTYEVTAEKELIVAKLEKEEDLLATAK